MIPKFTDKFVNYLIKLVPDNIRQELDFIVTKNKTGYIRLNENKLESVYLICQPKKLQGRINIKYKYNNKEFEFDNIYYSPDMHNEFRYNKDLEIDAVYLVDMCILPVLDAETKKHYFNVLKNMEKVTKIIKKDNDYISACQVAKNNNKTEIFYVISGERCGDKVNNIELETKKIIKSITENFNISKALYGCKAIYKNNNVEKSDPIYLIVYDSNAEKINIKNKTKEK